MSLPPLPTRELTEEDIADTLAIVRHAVTVNEPEILDILEPLTKAQKVQLWKTMPPSLTVALKQMKALRDTPPDAEGVVWV